MKKVFWLVLLFAFKVGVSAQYTVLHCEGTIFEKTSGKPLKVGQVLNETDYVSFRSQNASMCLWHAGKGRQVSKAATFEAGKTHTPYEFVSAVMKPGAQGKSLPEKGYIETKEELITYFKRGNHLFLGPTGIRISSALYPQDSKRCFLFKFNWPNQNADPKAKLRNVSDSLVLDPKLFLTMNGIPVPAAEARDFELIYFAGSKQYQEICAFKAVFPNEEQLIAETKALLALISQSPDLKLEARSEVHGFLADCYGHPDKGAFERWYAAQFETH